MFEFEVAGNFRDGKLRLASITPDKHMNFVAMPDKYAHETVTLSAEAAKEVRDALIRAYPLPNTEPEPEPYLVREDGSEHALGDRHYRRFKVTQRRPEIRTVEVAATDDAKEARKIAQALNEAEGL